MPCKECSSPPSDAQTAVVRARDPMAELAADYLERFDPVAWFDPSTWFDFGFPGMPAFDLAPRAEAARECECDVESLERQLERERYGGGGPLDVFPPDASLPPQSSGDAAAERAYNSSALIPVGGSVAAGASRRRAVPQPLWMPPPFVWPGDLTTIQIWPDRALRPTPPEPEAPPPHSPYAGLPATRSFPIHGE